MRVVENLKSMILTALIISSLVLTGSLWFDNYQGLSFAISKIPDLFLNDIDQEEYSKIYEEIILPYKVTVINPDKNKWIAYSSDKVAAVYMPTDGQGNIDWVGFNAYSQAEEYIKNQSIQTVELEWISPTPLWVYNMYIKNGYQEKDFDDGYSRLYKDLK